MKYTFHKRERLKSQKLIERIFTSGKSFLVYPFKIVWIPLVLQDSDQHSTEYPIQFGVSVPKRRYAKAVQRNRIKRLMREAYRLHKHLLYEKLEDSHQRFAIMAIYVGKEELSYEVLAKASRKWIKKFTSI